MPLGRDDGGHEPFEFGGIVDQLGEQIAQVPFEQDLAHIEYDGADVIPANAGIAGIFIHR